MADKIFDLIIVKQPSDDDVKLAGYEWSYTETKIVFEKTLKRLNDIDESGIQDTDHCAKNIDFFKELAYESGQNSRFLLDPNFGEALFKKLYDEWIINSLNKKFAIKIFFVEKENQAIGFITLQKDGQVGKIGLIATHPKFQGQGIGKKLLKFAENYCFDRSLTKLEIPTQKQNVEACKFYEKQGYVLNKELIIKHFWRK